MVDFSTGLLIIGLLAALVWLVLLSARVRELERRLAAGPTAPPVQQPQSQPVQAAGPPPRLDVQDTGFAGVFEQLIGGRVLIWVGGIALVVAAIFLIRYSIELGLITPAMRMIAAGLFGAVLLGLGEWAHASKRLADDKRVSQALVGAGLAVLYATVYGSYLLYEFIGINTASVLMLAITAAALGLSLRHGIGTAALGLIGGFLTPWLVGDPAAGALPLLAYLALLNVAVFAIAWRRNWGWLTAVAVLATFAWTAALLTRPPADAVMAGWFAVGFGIVAAMLRPAGTSLTWVQPISIAALEVTVLVWRQDVGTAGWLAYAVIAIAAVVVTRIKEHPPAVPFLVLVLGVLLIPVRVLFLDETGIVAAAVGMTLLFGLGSLALSIERKSGLWAALAAVGFAAPGLSLRWSGWDLLSDGAWGTVLALLALGPIALVFIRRRQVRTRERLDFLALLPALTAAGLLTLAAVDLVPTSGLSIAWLVLSIALIVSGMVLRDLAVRLAGLIVLTLTVLKLFLIDASGLDNELLRILSFLGLGGSLIVLGWFYGTLLRGERKAPDPAADGLAVTGGARAG
jgi:uncharacterized membrane protein